MLSVVLLFMLTPLLLPFAGLRMRFVILPLFNLLLLLLWLLLVLSLFMLLLLTLLLLLLLFWVFGAVVFVVCVVVCNFVTCVVVIVVVVVAVIIIYCLSVMLWSFMYVTTRISIQHLPAFSSICTSPAGIHV